MRVSIEKHNFDGSIQTINYSSRKRSERAAQLEFCALCKVDLNVEKVVISGRTDFSYVHPVTEECGKSVYDNAVKESKELSYQIMLDKIKKYPNSLSIGDEFEYEALSLTVVEFGWGWVHPNTVAETLPPQPIYLCVDKSNSNHRIPHSYIRDNE